MSQSQQQDSDRAEDAHAVSTAAGDRQPAETSTPAERLHLGADEKTTLFAGWTALVNGKTGEALAKFREVLQARPSSVEAQYGEAATLKAMNRGDEAITAYKKAIESLGHVEDTADSVRTMMFKHLAEAALEDLQSHGGKPAAYTPPR